MSVPKITDLLSNFRERVTSAMAVINTDHKYIHEGIAFKSHLDIGGLAGATSEEYSLLVPAGKYLHFKNLKLISVGASVKVELRRGTVASPLTIDSAGGAASELIGPNNANDMSTIASGVLIKKTPTYTGGATGVLWDRVVAPGDSTNQYSSIADSKMSDNFELVMKPATYYVLKFTNMTASDAASDVSLEMFWYEESGT